MYLRWLSSLGILASIVSRGVAQGAGGPPPPTPTADPTAGSSGAGIQLDLTSDDSIKNAAKLAAKNMMAHYTGDQPGQIPGLLPLPYYWWLAGAMFGQLIHYWNLTGDTTYNDKTMEALLFQIGDDKNYMPQNRSKDLGNDDQVFWAFAAMDAAELGFKNPSDQYPSWVALAQAVWNSQIPRWETTTCGGGLRWQIYPFNAGYQYKNTISTGGLFQLSARLARYTGNQTYADWAEKTFQWLYNSPIMEKQIKDVWDGTTMTNNCSDATHVYWTYNAGTMLAGSAYMYNFTNGSQTWTDRVNGFLNSTNVFFVKTAGANQPPALPPGDGDIMCEVACEPPQPQTCNYDQPSFKAYLSRWMAVTSQLAPFTEPTVTRRLQESARRAANQCAGQGKNMCGRRWYQDAWDGFFGVGEQMSALSIFQNNLIKNVAPPVTFAKGGTSEGDPNAGGSAHSGLLDDPSLANDITTGDRAGAGILTFLSVVLVLTGTSWIVI